jgi:ketosteroid isomerase-like protein
MEIRAGDLTLGACTVIRPPERTVMPARTPEEMHALLGAPFNAGDLDALADVYEGDAALIVPPESVVANGRDEIRSALEATVALAPTAKIVVDRKIQSGGLALTHAPLVAGRHRP